jgi:lipoprotein-releasing system ATP-binding protein
MSALISCAKLVRELGSGVKTRVLDEVDLEIGEGEFVSITGSSGSGKSTLLYLLGALDRPSSGSVVIAGRDVGRASDAERSLLRSLELGFVFQFHFLLPEFSVLENVLIPMLRAGKFPSERAARERAKEVLASLGLAGLAGRLPSQLSGGQQQRVSIARAVAARPRILLADEPTGNLDTHNGEAVIEIFERLAREHEVTVVMVTHEARFALRASRRVVMSDGRVVSDSAQSAGDAV